MAITDWPKTERPRERLLAQGAAALSDAELLALFLRVGTPGKSAVDLARQLIGHFGSLNRLFSASLDELSAIPGIGEAKYAQLQAVFEMARRALREPMAERDVLTTPGAVRDYLSLYLAGQAHETFHVLWLDVQHRLILGEELFRGTLTRASVYPREVVKRALACNAAAVILAHNHPSGEASASDADRALTRALKSVLAHIEVEVLDHFIVAGPARTVSFAEMGWL